MSKFKIGDKVKLKFNYRELKPWIEQWRLLPDYLSQYEGRILTIDCFPTSEDWEYQVDLYHGEQIMTVKEEKDLFLEQCLFEKEK